MNDLFSEEYLSRHLFNVCICFFGQLIARPRSMQGYIQYLRPGMQVSQHSTLAL
jgi:hypothetical protein